MGILDDIGASINRGTEAVGRGTRAAQLKLRQNELVKERQGLAAQLGAALYDKLKDNPEITSGLEQLFNGIAAIDDERASIQAEIESLEAAATARSEAAVTLKCPGCGAMVSATDMFCSGCGKPIAEIKAAAEAAAVQSAAYAAPVAPVAAAPSGPTCPSCGAPIVEGDAFCMGCGQKLDAPEA